MIDKSVLLEKRKNLLGNNTNAPEIFTTKGLINLRDFFSDDELLIFVENKASIELKTSKTIIAETINNAINAANDPTELQTILNNLHFTDVTLKPAKDWDQYKKDLTIDLIAERVKILNDLLENSLSAKVEYYDTSVWRFYLCYGVLEGILKYPDKEDLYLHAPLINVEIEITKNENGEYIFTKLNDEPSANEILDMVISAQIEKHTGLIDEISKEHFSAIEYFKYVANLFPLCTVAEQNSEVAKISKEALNKAEPHLTIQRSFFVLNFNPIGGKMLRDYDTLLERDYQFPTYDTIFHHDLNNLIYDEDKIYEINNPLNLTQKLAIVNASNKNILVYGPPGTGKSEVVANIIANVLISNKSTMVISEKKAALDVLDHRLLALSTLSMSAFDEKNKNLFYEKIIDLNHLIVSSNNIKFEIDNKDYLNLISYQKVIAELQNYHDINGRDVYAFMSNYDSINLILYERHIESIRFIFNKLKTDNIGLSVFIDNVRTLSEIQMYYESILDDEQVKVETFQPQRIQEFLNAYETVEEKNKKFVIRKFLSENLILQKKPFGQLRNKHDEKINVERILEIFHTIIDKKIFFVLNNRKILSVINEMRDIAPYIGYYDWNTNTKISALLNDIRDGKYNQSLIKSYWNARAFSAKKTDTIIRDYYLNILKEKLLGNHDLESRWTELVRKANLVKRPNINKIIKEYYATLKAVFPIWILSPDAAASIVPLEPNEFDYGIFDEASQMRIERGLPLVYRCRFAIVSGDDKQLRPTSFFAKSVNLDETYEGHLDNVDSLLDKAKSSNWMSFTLNNHYRSVSEQLIYFSSRYFYNDELVCISKNGIFKKTIDVYQENGLYDRENGINEAEAHRVIQCLLQSFEQYHSVIVVTFNIKQAEYIQGLASANADLRQHLENLSLKVRSLENVQGDEADLVIISATFGKDKNNKFLQNFGPINQEGGKNRINVMVSRAKEKMIVIKSFLSSDITNDNNENALIFKNFISYVEQLQDGNNILRSLGKKEETIIASDTKNEVINQIIDELKINTEWVVEKNKQVGTHIMNVAVTKMNVSTISLCILIDDKYDNEQYALNNKLWVGTIDKQRYYEDRGYHTFRINQLEWLNKRHEIMKLVKQQII